jgi:hypothetical protein
MKQVLRLFVLAAAVLALTFIAQQQHEPARAQSGVTLSDDLRQALQQYGEIPIIIELDVPGHATRSAAASWDEASINAMAQAITAVADGVLNRLAD